MSAIRRASSSPATGSATLARARLLHDPVMRCSTSGPAQTLHLPVPTRMPAQEAPGTTVLSAAEQRRQLLQVIACAFENYYLAALHHDAAQRATTAILRPCSATQSEPGRAVRVDAYGNLHIVPLPGTPRPEHALWRWQWLTFVLTVLGLFTALALLIL